MRSGAEREDGFCKTGEGWWGITELCGMCGTEEGNKRVDK